MTRNTLQLNALLAIVLLIGSLGVLNLITWHHLGSSRLDLTDSQRWRVADVTREVLDEMQQRYEALVEQAESNGPLSEAEKDELRVHVDFYVSEEPPPTVIDRFLDAEERLRDIEELAGDFLVVRRKGLIPDKTVTEIEEAEEYHLATIREIDELGRMVDLYCGLVLRFGEETKVLHDAMPPVDLESWLVRTMSAFIDTEPAKVWVVAPYELQSARLTSEGRSQLQGFLQELQDWIRSQNIDDMQEVQRLMSTYRPKLLRNDLRRLLPKAAIVKILHRIDETSNAIPEDCDLLILMKPTAELMNQEALKQISGYLANGGTVIALAPRYEVRQNANPQAGQLEGNTIELGEFGSYLESLGVTIRPEVVAQLPCYTMPSQAQVAGRDTAGRREALQARLPFWPRLDAEDRFIALDPRPLQALLMKSIVEAIEFHQSFLLEYQKEEGAKRREILTRTLADAQTLLQGWADVWRDRGASVDQGERGVWRTEESRYAVNLLEKAIEREEENLETLEEDLEVYRRDLRDLEARERAELIKWGGLDSERRREMTSEELLDWLKETRAKAGTAGSSQELAEWREVTERLKKRASAIEAKEEEEGELKDVIELTRRLHTAMNLARRGFLSWLAFVEEQPEEAAAIHRRAFLRQIIDSRTAIEQGVISPLVQAMTRDFELWLAFDEYLGGPEEVVSRVVATAEEMGIEAKMVERDGRSLFTGPGSLTDGLNHAYLMWPNPIEVDPKKLEEHGLSSTVIARTAARALYVREPSPLGAEAVLRDSRAGMGAFEAAMLREASNPEKANRDLPGGMPLVLLLQGKDFPRFEEEIERRPIADALRQLTAPPFVGGPLPLEGDSEDTPEFDGEKGWQRGGLAGWSLTDLAETVREVRDGSDEKRAGEGAEPQKEGVPKRSGREGRMLILGNLSFAMENTSAGQGAGIEIGLTYHEFVSPGINGVPFLRRILEWGLRGDRFEELDRRLADKPRELTNFRNQLMRESPEIMAASTYMVTLKDAASATPYLQDAGNAAPEQGSLLGNVKKDPVEDALVRLLEGVDSEDEERKGLEGVLSSFGEEISLEADQRENAYETWGVLLAPVSLLLLLLLSLFVTWARYR